MRSLFSKFGIVQTCIVNTDKRHAFIKMISRQDAIAAREGMESYKTGDMQLRVSFLSCALPAPLCSITLLAIANMHQKSRHVGGSDLGPATAVTIRLESV